MSSCLHVDPHNVNVVVSLCAKGVLISMRGNTLILPTVTHKYNVNYIIYIYK